MKTLFSGRKAFEHLKKLTVEFGQRSAGSNEERESAAYIESQFERYGLKTSLQVFQVTSYQPELSKLEVLEPKLGEIPAELVGLCGPTPPSGVLGELAFIETGDEEHLTPDLRGKILLVVGPVRYGKYGNLMKTRPKGIVVIEPKIGKPPSRVDIYPEWREKFGAAPMVRISLEDGLNLVKKGARVVRMRVQFSEKKTRSANVKGELKGKTMPGEIIVVGAHYDSSPGVQGACDNASGTAMVLELARVFSIHGSARTIRFIAWGAEELGLRGSVHYSQELKRHDSSGKGRKHRGATDTAKELLSHRLCVNLDVHGGILGSNEAMILGPADLASSIRLLSKERGPAIKVVNEVHSSDSTALSRVGIPSVSLTRKGATAEYLHTPLDEIGYLDAKPLEMYGSFIEAWMKRYVADALSFPFERRIPEAHKRKIDDYFKKRRGTDLRDE